VSKNGVFYRKFSGVCSWRAGLRVVGNTATFCAACPAGPWCALHHVRVRLPVATEECIAMHSTASCSIASAHALDPPCLVARPCLYSARRTVSEETTMANTHVWTLCRDSL